jgi:hypothetical protein
MKAIILSFLILPGAACFGQVSDTLLPNVLGSWTIKHWQYDGWSTSGGDYYTLYFEIYDTITWNGQTWNMVYANGTEGLMRSDSGKVYCRGWFEQLPLSYAPADTAEQLLYDFNMVVGDTAYFEEGTIPVIVESIGVSTILSVPKKAWFLDNGDTIVQGLGSTKGLFRPWTSFFEANEWICDFYGIYKDSSGATTDLFFSTSACLLEMQETAIENVTCIVANGELWITLIEPAQLELYSSDGKRVYHSGLESGQTVLNIEGVDNGLYILRVGSGYTKKIMVSH